MSGLVRLGTVGTGWIVDTFLEGVRKVEEIRPAAVYSRGMEKARAFAARHGIPLCFDSLEEMASSEEIDAVYIASPNALHAEQTLLFLRAGKHVLCEKPATVFPGEMERLTEEADRRGLVYLEAVMPLHLPRFRMLAEAAETLGRLSLVRLDFAQYSSKYPAYLAGEVPNIFNPKLCTGALEDLGVYCVNLAVGLFGAPDAVHASASFLGSGADGAGCAILKYRDFQAVLTYSKIGGSRIGSEIVGEKGTISLSSVSQLENLRLGRRGEEERILFGTGTHSASMEGEARDFAGCILRPQAYAEAWVRWSRLMRESARVMLDIRREAGIRFPGDPEGE